MERPVRVRFAPSPTGPLHIGGVRTALYNYLFAKKHGGACILRIEDTDQTRYVEGAEKYIIEACNWLGFNFDEGPHMDGGEYQPYRQSERKPIYRQYAEKMVTDGFAYYAFDTSKELTEMREKLEAARMPSKYDSASRMSMKNSLTLSADEVEKRLERGDSYVIRIKLPRKEEIRFHDAIRGWVVVHSNQMDDKVLLKGDGMPTYHLANVVDDYLMKISHVIRGEEWLPSAPLHVMLYRYLGWEDVMPTFAHLPLLLKPEGNGKLSKRDGDRLGFPVFPLEWKSPEGVVSTGYRESGYLAEAVLNILALLGWHPSDNQEMFSLDELVEAFSLEKVSKSGAKFDIAKAKWFNHKYIQETSNTLLKDLLANDLKSLNLDFPESYILSVIEMMKEKVDFTSEILPLSMFFFVAPTSYDEKVVRKKWKGDIPSILKEYANTLESLTEYNSEECKAALEALASKHEKGIGSIMQPLRVAVSGNAGGPPIFDMLELIGQKEVVQRLNVAISSIAVSA
jgi:glutamyl-tRNA synthetase